MRIRIFITIVLLLNAGMLFAQSGDPQACLGTDIDNPCPLDTWVIVLAFVAIVFAAIHLHNKQKQSPSGLQR